MGSGPPLEAWKYFPKLRRISWARVQGSRSDISLACLWNVLKHLAGCAKMGPHIGTLNVMELLLSFETQISFSVYLRGDAVYFFGNLLGDLSSLFF